MHPPDALHVQGSVRVFGHDDATAELVLLPRSTAWRATRAGALTAGGLVAAPVVALLPPHAAWALGSVIAGVVLGSRKWAERFTLLSLESPCPRCNETIVVKGPARFVNGATVSCDACHHAAKLDVPEAALSPTA